jgi:hypothetical protein
VAKAIRILGLAALVLIMALGCSGVVPGGSGGRLAIKVIPATADRTLTPPISMTCTSYHVACTAVGETEQDFDVTGNTTVSLAPDTWTVTVTGKNAQSAAIGSGSNTAVVTLGGSVTCNVTVTPYTGAGNYALEMKWNAVALPFNTWTVTSTLGGSPLVWTVAHDGYYDATASGSVPAGYKTLIAQVNNGTFDPLYPSTTGTVQGWVDVVRVVQDQTTTGSVNFLTSGQVIVGITQDMHNPIVVTMSGLPPTGPVTVNVPVSLSATATGATTLPVVYTWYCDGWPLTATGNTCTWTPTAVAAHYDIACTAYSADGSQGGCDTKWIMCQ